jgi:hypothetical protein
MGGMAAVAALASAAGTVISAVGTIATGQAQKRAAELQARHLEINAKEERAAAQRQAMEYERQTRRALSRAQALAATSGFGATDTTVLDQSGEIARYGTLQKQMAQYGGDSRAAGLRAQAEAARASGQADLIGSYYRAGGTLLSGFSSLYGNYGDVLGWKPPT